MLKFIITLALSTSVLTFATSSGQLPLKGAPRETVRDFVSTYCIDGHGQVKNIIKARTEICSFQFKQIARMAQALQAVPEGDGTMLDNTVFVYTSDNGETHHSGGVNYPIMILGNLGGRLKTRRYFAPGNEEKIDRAKSEYTRLGDVWATLLAAAGQPYVQFGIPVNGVAHKPIESLLT